MGKLCGMTRIFLIMSRLFKGSDGQDMRNALWKEDLRNIPSNFLLFRNVRKGRGS